MGFAGCYRPIDACDQAKLWAKAVEKPADGAAARSEAAPEQELGWRVAAPLGHGAKQNFALLP
jgi:hypothetical protein